MPGALLGSISGSLQSALLPSDCASGTRGAVCCGSIRSARCPWNLHLRRPFGHSPNHRLQSVLLRSVQLHSPWPAGFLSPRMCSSPSEEPSLCCFSSLQFPFHTLQQRRCIGSVCLPAILNFDCQPSQAHARVRARERWIQTQSEGSKSRPNPPVSSVLISVGSE